MKVTAQKSFRKGYWQDSDKKLAGQVALAIQEMESCKKSFLNYTT
jgi:ribulose bisphosphate carboxylase small subunit